MSDCLTDEQLERLAGDILPAIEAAPLRAHLESCSLCRETYDECVANRQFETVVRSALGPEICAAGMPDSPPWREEQIPGYQILEEIHRGAQGVIYKAVNLSSQQQVAIKFLRDGSYASESSRRRFEREIELAGSLVHPHVIRLYESGVSPTGRLYYVMDYVQGLPLHHYVWDHHLTIDEALQLFVKVCDAVNFAHQRGVIHRDLKPSNILVDANGSPRVLDFGLAKQMLSQPETMLSLTGQVMGTLPFMSPEQAAGGREPIDIRADVYALGVMLYLLLTGHYPYPVSGSIPQVIHHIARTPPMPLRKTWSETSGVRPREGVRRPRRHAGVDLDGQRPSQTCPIDDDVETIALKTLAKEPERRYQNVAMLMDDVSRYLRGQPIEARRDIGLMALHRKLTRYKAVTALAVLCVGLVGIFAQALWWMYQTQSRQREQFEAERARAVEAHAQLAAVVMKLGDAAVARGEREEALGQYLAALTIQRHLAASEPNNKAYGEELVGMLLRVGDMFRQRGEAAKAAEYYDQGRRLAEQLLALDPGRKTYEDLGCAVRERVAPAAQSRPEADRPPSPANKGEAE